MLIIFLILFLSLIFFTDSQFKLSYCISCNETKEYNENKESTCWNCKSILKHKCGRCMKIYSSKDSLRAHLSRECNRFPNFSCHYCKYKSYRKHDLIQHIQAIHLPQNPNLNKCKRCGKNFSQRSSLLRHLRVVCFDKF